MIRALPPPVHAIHWSEADTTSSGTVPSPEPDPAWQRGRHYATYQEDSQRDAYRALTLHGLGLPTTNTDLLVGSLNVNGLTLSKVTELLWYMRHRHLDALLLLDTRSWTRESSRMCKHLRATLGPGSGAYACPAFGASASRKGTHTRASMVGGQLLLISPRWAARVIRVIEDPTHLGVMFGVLLAGPQGPIEILGVYWPCPPPSAGELHMGLHSKLQQWLHRMAIPMAPMDYLRGLIRGRVLRHLGHSTDSAPHPMSLVLGDFNASWDNRHGPHKGLTPWAGSCGLINPFAYVAHTILYPLASFYAGLRPVRLIDHGLISHSFMGLVTLSALDDGSFWSTVTDHRPILLGLALFGASLRQLGTPLKRPPWGKVDVPAIPALLQQYQAQLADRPCIPVSDAPTTYQYLFQVSVDSAAMALALTPAPRPRGKRWKDGWSPIMMCLKANLEVLWHIWGHLRGSRGHTLWRTQTDMDTTLHKILAPWETLVHSYKWSPPLQPEAVFALGGYPPSFWKTTTLRKLDTAVVDSLGKVRRQLHGRNRTYLRTLISAHVLRRETSRLKGKVGKVIRSILHEEIRFYPLETLRLTADQIIIDARQIHSEVTAHFNRWYSATEPAEHILDWWDTRDRASFLTAGKQAHIPDHLLPILWTDISHVPHIATVATALSDTLTSPPSLQDFQRAIHGIRSSTSPGASGLTYGMIKHWPDSLIASVYDHLASLWESKAVPPWWQDRWLCPIPKVPDPDPSMDDLRPLMLVEVLRKLWVGIIIDKITTIWDRYDILAPTQHGFRPRRGTDTALLNVLNTLEQGHESGLPLYSSSWDIKRAFDSISRPFMVLAWNRLGVPLSVAKWLAYMDDGGTVMIRTPLAMTHFGASTCFPAHATSPSPGFSGEIGTPQGDVSSPAAWVAVFDILLRSLEATLSTPFGIRGQDDEIYPAPEVAYADDLNTFSATKHGLQAQADTVSAFTVFFGLRIAAGKLRLGVFGAAPSSPPESIIIHHKLWAPQTLPLRYTGIVRILGFHFQLDGAHTYQHQQTKQRLHLACAAMATAIRSSPAGVALTAMVSCLARATYTGQFGAWDPAELHSLETPLNTLFRRLSGLLPTSATHLLYMPSTLGGMGFPSLYDYIQRRKWTLVHRSLHMKSAAAQAVGGLLNRAARSGG